MAWYRVTRQSFINGRDALPGQVVQYDGQPGKALVLMSEDEVKKHLASLDVPPTKTLEQRVEALEEATGDNDRRGGRSRTKASAPAET